MDCVDRLGAEFGSVDPRVWDHLLTEEATPREVGSNDGLGPALEDAAYDCLSALAGVDTHDVNLRDHGEAWAAIEAFAAKVQAAERERCAQIVEAYRVPADYVPAVHTEELVHALQMIAHATAPSPAGDGGHHEAAYELAIGALKRVEARQEYERKRDSFDAGKCAGDGA